MDRNIVQVFVHAWFGVGGISKTSGQFSHHPSDFGLKGMNSTSV